MRNLTFVQDERDIRFAMVSKELLMDTEVITKGSTAMVYISLCLFANNSTGESFPLINSIGKYARCGKRTVHEALKLLEESGYISREKRFNVDGGMTSNLYRILK